MINEIKYKKEIDLIQQFEPVFIEAAEMAAKLKKDAVSKHKLSTGNVEVDIVTSADLAVQEFVLQKLVKSDLKNCELIAEEDTPSRYLFAKSSNLVLTIDPIDGTAIYAQGKKMYSIVITIHDKKRPIYTFDYFPEIKWGVKIVYDKCEFIGNKPKLTHKKLPLKTIIYSFYNSKERTIENSSKMASELVKNGYAFRYKKDFSDEVGGTAMFILGIADGFFTENGSAVDTLVSLHYALSQDLLVYQDINIEKPIISTQFNGHKIYPGGYLAIHDKKLIKDLLNDY